MVISNVTYFIFFHETGSWKSTQPFLASWTAFNDLISTIKDLNIYSLLSHRISNVGTLAASMG